MVKIPHKELEDQQHQEDVESDTDRRTIDTEHSIDGTEEDDEESSPPIFKYTRLTQIPATFFQKDHISMCNFHESVFLFATHSGVIHITDIYFAPIRTFKAHRASVLSLYTDGKFFASGSMDGTVVIGSIYDEKDIIAYDFKRPVHSVVLDPNYPKSRSFFSGGMNGKVIYSSKNWLGQKTDVVIDEGEGPVVSIHFIDDLLIWMNDRGITIYHFSSRKTMAVIDKPQDSPRGDLYWPKVSFPETDRILIGWGNYVWSLRISIKTDDHSSRIIPSTATISFRSVQEKEIQVEHVFKLDFLVSGILSFRDDLWMLLSYEPPSKNVEGKLAFHCPDLKLINSSTGEVVFEEEIGLRNIDNLGLNDYMLGCHLDSTSRHFILSATDGVVVEELQLIDRVNWYIERERYLDAWEISEHLLSPIKRLNIGIQYVDSLLKDDKWDEAKQFLESLLYVNPDEISDFETKSRYSMDSTVNDEKETYIKEKISQWDTWANIFIDTRHFKEITEILPSSPRLNVPKKIYNSILVYWLHEDQDLFRQLIDTWNTSLYDLQAMQTKLEEQIETAPDNVKIERCLSDLYVKSFRPEKAVPHLIHLKDPNITQFLARHHLLINFLDDLPNIVTFRFSDSEMSTLPIQDIGNKLADIIDVLVDHRHEILPKDILSLFFRNHQDFICYFYLEKLALVDEYLTQPLGNERIELYALFNRKSLLPFLAKNSNYNIDEAISLCERNDFTEELVYLLGKIGENRRALTLIINKLDDPDMAIEFAKRQNDKEAWNSLLDFSMTKPAFIKALLECADEQSNSFYDPISILERMPENIDIEGFKNTVIKFSNKNELTLLLNQLILRIILEQSSVLSKSYKLEKLRGFEVSIDSLRQNDLVEKYQPILIIEDKQEKINYELESLINKNYSSKSYSRMKYKIRHFEFIKKLFK